jgi:hypothetical protein
MEPRGELSSTGYMLANPGVEYLILQADETSEFFTVTLKPGVYSVEWYSLTTRQTMGGGKLTVEDNGSARFKAPFAEAGPSVVYLNRADAAPDEHP